MANVSIENEIENIKISDGGDVAAMNGTGDEYTAVWGFTLDDLYRLALKFYKDQEGKAVHISYQDKIKLVAYTKQVKNGKYRTDTSPDVGFLDVVGGDRRQAWLALGDMSRTIAMGEFVRLIDTLCPLFKPYVEAHKTEQEEQERKRREEEDRKRREAEENERQKLEDEAHKRQEEEAQRRLQQELQIRTALNQQTAIQFRQYAEQQLPDDKEKQEVLIQQLQEQHFQQYMQQVYQQQLQHQQEQYHKLQAMAEADKVNHDELVPQNDKVVITETESPPGTAATTNGDTEEENESDNDLPPIAAASMWTRKDVKEFKDSLRKDKDAVIKVGSGETVTVRVPTHEDGTCLFWEFATDNYDVGFGVYFEWTIAPNNTVSVHVSESSDEEELDEDEGKSGEGGKSDVEKGSKQDNKPPTDEIIPIYRRDCHEEVYCGSHMYPGQGVYLLKFDNSYSLWRSKTLYYRVYYTR